MSAETIAKRTATRRLRREERLRAVVDALDLILSRTAPLDGTPVTRSSSYV
jgi:hypothetical protein